MQHYLDLVDQGNIEFDPEQHNILKHMAALSAAFAKQTARPGAFQRLKQSLKPTKPIQGLYIYGSVGVGKTFLMDLLLQHLPTTRKIRRHFHEFMTDIHQQLHQRQGQANPLESVADQIKSKADILCFDEMSVDDITDAMLLGDLLKALFKRQITLVTTSNVAPDDLYLGGLQRQRFLPAIKAIKAATHTIHVQNHKDYRRTGAISQEHFFSTHDPDHLSKISAIYQHLSQQPASPASVNINGRNIRANGISQNIAWFDFHTLCQSARNQSDYLALSERFNTIFLTNVPQLHAKDFDALKRFINLIDILYDRQIKLYLSANSAIDDIYSGNKHAFEFARTRSRLTELLKNTIS